MAGVSVTTVSHVINETRPVSDGLRLRVTAAAHELGYRPNLLARGLRCGQTHTLGVIVPDSANSFFAELTRGIEDTAFEVGYNIILCNSDGNLDKELLYANVLTLKQVDGILFVAAGVSAEHIVALRGQDVPVVIVDRELPETAADSVLTDNSHGGWLATRHLLDLGHRRIGCVAGPGDLAPSAARLSGFRRALAEARIPADEGPVAQGDFRYRGGHQAAHRLLSTDSSLTAIFACNDLMAIGAISAAVETGRHVPSDLSVVGFDNVSAAAFSNPTLTTVAQPTHEMGVVAARMLLDRLRNPSTPPQRRVLGTELIVRNSTAPTPARLGVDGQDRPSWTAEERVPVSP
jgi:LacI family transcriptional regulator